MASLLSSDDKSPPSSFATAPAASGEEGDPPSSLPASNFDPSDFGNTEGSTQRWLAAFRELEEQNLDSAFCSVVATTAEDTSPLSSAWCDAIRTDLIPSEWTVWASEVSPGDFSALAPQKAADREERGRQYTAAAVVAASISDKLQTSMAYSNPMLPKDAADAWARSFVESMNSGGTPAQWFTNISISAPHPCGASASWNSVTKSTFDACFVAARPDLNIAAYILLSDED